MISNNVSLRIYFFFIDCAVNVLKKLYNIIIFKSSHVSVLRVQLMLCGSQVMNSPSVSVPFQQPSQLDLSICV